MEDNIHQIKVIRQNNDSEDDICSVEGIVDTVLLQKKTKNKNFNSTFAILIIFFVLLCLLICLCSEIRLNKKIKKYLYEKNKRKS